MNEYFVFASRIDDLFFKNWTVHSSQGFIGVCVALGSLTILLQCLRLQKEIVINAVLHLIISCKRRHEAARERRRNSDSDAIIDTGALMPMHRRTGRISCVFQLVQTGLYVIQMLLEYSLMLCAMTFNAWFMTSIVLGAAAGYFMFGYELPMRKVHIMSPKVSQHLEVSQQDAPFIISGQQEPVPEIQENVY